MFVKLDLEMMDYENSRRTKHMIASNYIAAVTRLKIMAGCDISEQRLPQDGAITVKDQSNNNIDVDVRFNTVPTKFGERICMRL